MKAGLGFSAIRQDVHLASSGVDSVLGCGGKRNMPSPSLSMACRFSRDFSQASGRGVKKREEKGAKGR